jgi:hypothetical protein
VQHRRLVQVEHRAAHQRGRAAAVGEGERAQQRLGLGHDVVVEEHDVPAAAGAQRLEHAAGEAAGAAEVGLLARRAGARRARRATSAKPGSSARRRVPWSTTTTSSTTARTSGSSASRRSRPSADAGRSKVVTASVSVPGVGTGRVGDPLRVLEDHVAVAGDDVEPHPAAVAVGQPARPARAAAGRVRRVGGEQLDPAGPVSATSSAPRARRSAAPTSRPGRPRTTWRS